MRTTDNIQYFAMHHRTALVNIQAHVQCMATTVWCWLMYT